MSPSSSSSICSASQRSSAAEDRLDELGAPLVQRADPVRVAGAVQGRVGELRLDRALFVLAQPGATAFNIYDARVHEVGLTMPNYVAAVDAGFVKRRVALRELAAQFGTPREGLEETIALVNALAFEEDSDDFGRRFHARRCCSGRIVSS